MTRHKTVQLPEAVADGVDAIVEKNVGGYRTRAEFVTDATRQLLRQMNAAQA